MAEPAAAAAAWCVQFEVAINLRRGRNGRASPSTMIVNAAAAHRSRIFTDDDDDYDDNENE